MGRRIAVAGSFLLALSCSPEPSGIVDAAGTPPVMRSVAPLAFVVDSDTILVGPDRLPNDVLEIRFPVSVTVTAGFQGQAVASVHCWVTNEAGVTVSPDFILNDDGVAGDTLEGDSRFGGSVLFSVQRVEVGTWHVRIAAVAENGAKSPTVLIPVHIVRNNRPPFLSDLVAESTVSASAPDPLTTMTVKAIDPDGKPDLRKVYFNSYLPSGQGASGNPFQMFDDGDRFGLSGDLTAADSLYSIRIQFAGAPTGTYRFEFGAVDRSSDSSNVIIHQIQVTP